MMVRHDSGFTLVEALVALVIMILVAGMLYRGFGSGLRVSEVAQAREYALDVARARLAGAGIETPLQAGRRAGQDGPASWELVLTPYQPPDEADRAANMRAFWATVTVTWGEGRNSRPAVVQLTTLKVEAGR